MPRPGASTAFRIAALYGFSFAAASLLLGAVTWSFASRSLRQTLDDRLRGELTTLLRAGAREGQAALIADIGARDAVPGEGGYLLLDRRGRRIAGRVVTTLPRPGLTDVTLRAADGATLPGRAATVRLPSGETLAVVGEARSLARIERTLLLISGAGLALMVAIGVGGGFLIGHAIRRRLAIVDATARAIIDGDFSRRMPVDQRDDEFGRLSATLNRMLDHIAQLMDSLRHVSDDIAHDLRSPLARLRATLEATAEAGDVRALHEGIGAAIVRVDGVIGLFGTILRISEVESGGVRGHFEPVPLDLLAAEIVESYEPATCDGGRTIVATTAGAVDIVGDRGLLGQAIVNLIENAIRHTPPGTHIAVDARTRSDGRTMLSIADDGPGIPPREHAAVLRRFGRGDASRTTAGHGLGLTLVAAIAAAHRAELRLEDATPGLVVRLVFPAKG